MTNYFKKIICDKISSIIEIEKNEIHGWIEIPKEKNMGDFALPCFKLSKHLKKNPRQIAEELKDEFRNIPQFSEIEAVNGYLNFKIDPIALIQDFFLKNKDYHKIGSIQEGEKKTVVVEFSSPNIAKPFGIGHLRSTVIGHSIANLFQQCGYNVIRINHLGDWGTQFGKLITAFLKWGDRTKLEKEPIHTLYELYVKFHQENKIDESLDQEAREWFRKLESGDKEAIEIWKEFKELSLAEFKKIYTRLGVHFDYFTGEAFYSEQLEECINNIVKKGITKKSEGALIVDLEKSGLPPCLLRKQDGATLYATRDICAAIYRKNTFDFHKNIYVVGSAQKLHFEQIFQVLKMAGHEWADDCIHVPFGMILGISTRKGTLVFLEDILNEAKERALTILKDREETIDNLEKTADKIAVSAIIFQDLSNRRIKDFEYDLERIISFDGDTGPYLQYTLVRIASIFRNIVNQEKFDGESFLLTDFKNATWDDILNEEALDLIKILNQFDTYVLAAKNQLEPSILANYLIELAYHFNRFYRTNRVIDSEGNYSQVRTALLTILYKYLKTGMEILGLQIIDRM